jgi:hypothetical protein
MDDPNSNTTGTLDQADEDILTYTASDEALEAAAGSLRGDNPQFFTFGDATCPQYPQCRW